MNTNNQKRLLDVSYAQTYITTDGQGSSVIPAASAVDYSVRIGKGAMIVIVPVAITLFLIVQSVLVVLFGG